MPFLYEKLDNWREIKAVKEMPKYIADNLNPAFELRPYQIAAFENYITWFESEKRPRPIQNLFHMATGSGKTLIMAGLMLYLYKQGYRNFLFFVNLSNIVRKTEDNFLNATSEKYLFANEIRIDGERVAIKKVENFQGSDPNAINICFTTIQGLHSNMYISRENSVSVSDFEDQKVALIADEAHHLNVSTKSADSNADSWEYTVKRIFTANKENVLLEFTATCDIENSNIRATYEDKIIFDYPLAKFREDKYSKEIKTLRCDISLMERAIQAIVLSQYRMKVFQEHRLSIKPAVLFKSAKIAESKENMQTFIDTVNNLTGSELERISTLTDNETMRLVWAYFKKNGITFEQLAQELRDDFGAEHCISANDDKEAGDKQITLNSLEKLSNPYRAIFEVQKLDEGWDVLNLFDIVRMYETRDSRSGKPGAKTVSEAQLIGRGARYCPFKIDDEQEKFKRKYDGELDNPLRICEELYYHCQNNSRYIDELKKALSEIGIDLDKTVVRQYVLKDSFKKDSLYKNGVVFANKRIVKSRNDVYGLLPSVKDRIYAYFVGSGSSGEDSLLTEETARTEKEAEMQTFRKTFAEIAQINYAIVQRALCKYPIFKFNVLQSYFPNLKSTREFITDENYLGNIRLEIRCKTPTPQIMYMACVNALSSIAGNISSIEETYEGGRHFSELLIHDVFKDKSCHYSNPHDGGIGVSQNDSSVQKEWKLDLSKEDWFVFEDNFGTSEEKAFVAYFKTYVKTLKEKYDKVYLIRNERQLHIYSFDSGERFEPDYLLFLRLPKENGYEQIQVFIEPKGNHLIETDKWKEDFLLQLEEKAIPITIGENNDYKIWGFHFYNKERRSTEFAMDMEKLN